MREARGRIGLIARVAYLVYTSGFAQSKKVACHRAADLISHPGISRAAMTTTRLERSACTEILGDYHRATPSLA